MPVSPTPTAGHKHQKADIVDFSHSHTEDTGWQNLTTVNGWVNYDTGSTFGGGGRPAQYRIINGIVFWRGVIRSGVDNTVAFILPPGARMAISLNSEAAFAMKTAGGHGVAFVNATTGEVTISGTNATGWTYLTGVSYPAEA